jgi:hypothetical protein
MTKYPMTKEIRISHAELPQAERSRRAGSAFGRWPFVILSSLGTSSFVISSRRSQETVHHRSNPLIS